MRPGFSRVGRFVNAIARRQVRTLQSFAAANVNNVRIGRSHRQRADGAGGLIVENRVPGIAEISGLPYAAIDRGHVENIRLVRHAGGRHSAASAEWPHTAPAHFVIKLLVELLADLLVELLRVRRSTK